MDKRAPQVHENTKTTLFVSGQKTSQIQKLAISDLASLKKGFCERFTKKNDIHPFEDASCMILETQFCGRRMLMNCSSRVLLPKE
jgi:ribosome production factor 2